MADQVATIYMKLLDEGVAVVRPVSAKLVRPGIYMIMDNPRRVPAVEEWEFLPGTCVRVENRKWGEDVLPIAVEAVECDPA